MQLTASHAGRLQGKTSLELMTGETPDISEYLYFGWYGVSPVVNSSEFCPCSLPEFLAANCIILEMYGYL